MFRELLSVLNFEAFRPEPDDSTASWKRRFSHRKSLLLNIGKSQTSWKSVGRGGRMLEGGVQDGDFKDVIGDMGDIWKEHADQGWIGVSLNNRYVISLETNLSRKQGAEELVKSNPRAVLGARYERGRRYAVTHNPESNTSIVLSCDEEYIRRIETLLKEAGLTPARICCGSYAMLRSLLVQANAEMPSETAEGEQAPGVFFVICCEGSICALIQESDQWFDLRSRADTYQDSYEPAVDLLLPYASRIKPDTTLAVLSDQPAEELLAGLRDGFAGREVKDYSREDALWGILQEH